MRRRVQLTHIQIPMSDTNLLQNTQEKKIFVVNVTTSSMYCDWLTVKNVYTVQSRKNGGSKTHECQPK